MSTKKLIYTALCLLLSACQGKSNQGELKLDRSIGNYNELQKVLDHYSQTPEDSLKYQAAVFLIENMDSHFTLTSESLTGFQDKLKAAILSGYPKDSITKMLNEFPVDNRAIKYDKDVMRSEVLIRNIDQAFEAWNKPWCRHLNFEEFCEYILPYKYGEYQALDDWRDSLCLMFNNSLSKLFVNDETYHSVYHIGKLINQEINEKTIINLDNKAKKGILFYKAGLIDKIPFGDCVDYTALMLAVMRSHGVPATIDFIPQWGHRPTGNHHWITVLNNNGKHLPIPHLHQNPGDVFFPMHILPKIYRQTYVPVAQRKEYLRKSSYVFNSLAQFHKDVTSEYTTTSDLSIPVDDKGIKDKYAYIACSSYRDWNVVDFGVIKNGQARFEQMGRNVVYLIMGYNGKSLQPIATPFLLDKDGQIQYFKPDHSCLSELNLWRKYPITEHVAHMEDRVRGGKVQATNDPHRKEWVTFYEIEDWHFPDLIPIETDQKYRYWRFLGRKWAYLNIAEFQLYNNVVEKPLTGKVIGSEGFLDNDTTYSHSKAFDEDCFTYFHSPSASEELWVGLDMHTPQKVKQVRCIPRSDDNGIRYGDTYELAYWNENGWKALGTQTATKKNLIFDSVPGNALLLLKNLTRGREERIFTYENGVQIWR